MMYALLLDDLLEMQLDKVDDLDGFWSTYHEASSIARNDAGEIVKAWWFDGRELQLMVDLG